MKEIKEIAAFINDEVEGVLEYAKAAVFYKETRPSLANAYNKLATVELQHVQQLHVEATKLIREADAKATANHIEYPKAMRDKWDEQHKIAVDKMAQARTYLGMFK